MDHSRCGKVAAVSVSLQKGTGKSNVSSVHLKAKWGAVGDAHAGHWHRQISLLAAESIGKMTRRGANVGPGDFGENITTEGIDLASLHAGDHIIIGQVILEVTQIGKECHNRCAIYHAVGDCVMPREGIFARVLTGGEILPGETVLVETCTHDSDSKVMSHLVPAETEE